MHNSPAFNFAGDWGGNHAWVRDPVTGDAVGLSGKSSTVFGPGDGEVNSPAIAIELPPGVTGAEAINALRNSKAISEPGLYIPGVFDCNYYLEKAFKEQGWHYPGAPGGRIDWNDKKRVQ
ncbi:MAG: hypothetical protein GF401_04290 [Chitinivibrionales bacterium]|nr:hypothetical protein [Chitinivibrionales bacterium]